MLSRSLIVLGLLSSSLTFASEKEGAARLGTPVVRPTRAMGTASTRTPVVRSHSELLRSNPWARGGQQVGYAKIGASRPAVATVNPKRPYRTHTQLQTTNAWAKPRVAVRRAPPVSATSAPKTIEDPTTNTGPTVVASKQSSPGLVRSTPKRQTPKSLPPKPPEFLKDLDALLARDSHATTRDIPTSPIGHARPVGPARGGSRIYTTQETVFEAITQATAFDSKETDSNVPADRATQLFASGNVPVAYHAAIHGDPAPLNRNVSAFHHNPLYFEERNLERCGNGYGCATTAVSAARFAGTTLAIPILLLGEYPRDCVPAGPDCPTCTELFVD